MKPRGNKRGANTPPRYLRPWNDPSKSWEPIPRFRQAVTDFVYYNRQWNMCDDNNLPTPELRAYLSAAQMELRAATYGTFSGLPAAPNGMTPEILKSLKPINPGILALFKSAELDATPIFRFIYDAQNHRPDLDEAGCLAALDNLQLHTTDKIPEPPSASDHPTIDEADKFIRDNPGAKGPHIAKAIHKTPEHVRKAIIPELKKRGIHRMKGKQGYYPPKV